MVDEHAADAAGIGRRGHRRDREPKQVIARQEGRNRGGREPGEAGRHDAAEQSDSDGIGALVLDGLVQSLQALAFTVGKEFDVVTVSIDPRDTPATAAATQAPYMQRYGRAEAAGWHFLTGEPEVITRLADTVGFRYVYDAQADQFAHASGIMVATPEGKLARYFYGLEYPPWEVRLSLVEAAAGRIGSPVDQLLLFCYHYDPKTGQYSLIVQNVLRIAGVVTVLTLGLGVGILLHRERTGKAR